MLPGKVKGVGGAMDLVANPEKTRVVVTMVRSHILLYPFDILTMPPGTRRQERQRQDSARVLVPPDRSPLRVEDYHRSGRLRRQPY